MSTREEEALATAQLEHAAVLVGEISRLSRLRELLVFIAALAARCRIEMLEYLVAQIAGAGTDNVTVILGRLEYRGTRVLRQLL